MKGYILAQITVTDPVRYQSYKDAAPSVIAAFGGRYLVKAPTIETLEGDALQAERIVVLEFDSVEQAKRFYHSDEYQRVAADRKASSISHFHIMEGCFSPA